RRASAHLLTRAEPVHGARLDHPAGVAGGHHRDTAGRGHGRCHRADGRALGAQPFGWMEKRIDSLWCSLPGSMVTVAVGTGLAALRGRTDQALTPDPAVTERMA